ncbi:HAD family hydrolase [Faecalicoccus pleomorphus]|uniref:HAD family hydrolase n=1 Tax=Faecalicoccus pleomorphus TaxID=1323 RepID=UPI00195F36C5|nr:HAD hydrolase-like protein [Faecalicoccus pleomorphus]MBM6808513.1 HAD family hydrolase [Faecalicoccus pleomorphus]
MKKIVWDWNGTLFDDIDLCLECINNLLVHHGLSCLPDKEAYRKVFGFPIENYYRAIGFDFTKTSFEELAHEYMEYYQEKSYDCSLVQDAYHVLKQARSLQIEQTILSASKKDYLLAQIQKNDVQKRVDHIYGIEDIYAHSKLELAKAYMKTCQKEDEVWFVGDSLHDYEVASQAGGKCLLVTTGHQSKGRLQQAGVPVLDSLKECLEVIYAGN